MTGAVVANRSAKGQGETDQPLLGAVVQVAFEPATFLVGRFDEPQPRCPKVGQLRGPLRPEPLIDQAEPSHHEQVIYPARVVEKPGTVGERGQRLVALA